MEMIPAKTIISGYSSVNKWFGNHYNMNIYKGCSHGCIYCDSRSDCYGVEHFDLVRAKENALALIEKELKSKRRTGVIGTGAMSDPYNPMEKDYQLTRGALALLNRKQFGISIATKSDLVVRDIDLLRKIKSHSPVLVKLTVTTDDDTLANTIEPLVSKPSERFKAIKTLTDAGIYTGVLMMPILPFIEDDPVQIQSLLNKVSESGAQFIYAAFGVTLRQNQREWFFKALDQHFPGVKAQYIRAFGNAYSCGSPSAKALYQILEKHCKATGLKYRMKDIIEDYQKDYGSGQISFFKGMPVPTPDSSLHSE